MSLIFIIVWVVNFCDQAIKSVSLSDPSEGVYHSDQFYVLDQQMHDSSQNYSMTN